MKEDIVEKIELPSGISFEVKDGKVICKKDLISLSRKIGSAYINVNLRDNSIILESKKASKREFKQMRSLAAHIRNMFTGLNNKFTYVLEACNVHFPMTLKADNEKVIINNFLGERMPRTARIAPGSGVEIKGTRIIITANDKESAGQTVANIEKATKVKNRDRRVFQDGIYLIERPGRNAR